MVVSVEMLFISLLVELMFNKTAPLLAAGSIETQLAVPGLDIPVVCLNESSPQQVLVQQQAWVVAGAQLLQANTRQANSWLLAASGWSSRAESLNAAGIALALQAQREAGKPLLVAACMTAPPAIAWQQQRQVVQRAWSEQAVYLSDLQPACVWISEIVHLPATAWLIEQLQVPILLEFQPSCHGKFPHGTTLENACQILKNADAVVLNCHLQSSQLLNWLGTIQKYFSVCGVLAQPLPLQFSQTNFVTHFASLTQHGAKILGCLQPHLLQAFLQC